MSFHLADDPAAAIDGKVGDLIHPLVDTSRIKASEAPWESCFGALACQGS
jgi:hypothetical protein